MEPVRLLIQATYASIGSGPRPLALRKAVSLLALSAPRVDLHLAASQLRFENSMIKQTQSLIDQMSMIIRYQQLGASPEVELGKHASGF